MKKHDLKYQSDMMLALSLKVTDIYLAINNLSFEIFKGGYEDKHDNVFEDLERSISIVTEELISISETLLLIKNEYNEFRKECEGYDLGENNEH
jgi:hypothetical protein